MTGVTKDRDRKFLTDSAWNYGAFALMAGTGVILNFFIAGFMGIEALGVFNQVYAIFVVVGQLAAMGIHDSAQKHSSEYADDPTGLTAVAAASAQTAALIGAAVAVVLYLASDFIGEVADSDAVGRGVALIAPGVGLFALNKTLMGILNGLRRMKEFAIAQSLRVLAILGFCLAVGLMDGPAYLLAAGFTVAEAILTPLLGIMTRPGWRRLDTDARGWMARHLRFGIRALPNGFLAESYIRVDIIMLGIFMTDAEVGIYSFAALFVEGLFQVPVVVRTVANPVLVRLMVAGDLSELVRFGRRAAAGSAAAYVLAAAGVLVVLPYLAPLFPAGLVSGAHELLFPLLGGLLIYAVFIPLDHILLQAGRPGRQSLLMAFNVAINGALNFALIPAYGLWGAAAATAASFVVSSISLNIAAGWWLGLKRGVLLTPVR